jgi:glucosyl-dolichyl phosphate glucuronosyltransferase
MNNIASPPYTLSAIIPTKNRPTDLVNAVRSILLQTIGPDELVIVDQTPGNESRTAVHELFANTAPPLPRLIYLHEPEISGASMARNRAMECCSANILLFLDDDVILEPEFVEALIETYQKYPSAKGISGVITNYQRSNAWLRSWSWLFARGPFHDERQAIYWHANEMADTDVIAVQKFGAGLMSFRADAIAHVRFDLNPCAFPAEDIDFCAQLAPGSLLLIAPRARLAHMKTPTARASEHWLQREVRVSRYLYKRHWHRSFKYRLCFWWLQFGYALAAAAASVRRFSLGPWSAMFSGIAITRTVQIAKATGPAKT